MDNILQADQIAQEDQDKFIRDSELKLDFIEFLEAERFYDFKLKEYKGNSSQEVDVNQTNYRKTRNALAKLANVDYRLIDQIVFDDEIVLTDVSKAKLRNIAQRYGLRVAKLQSNSPFCLLKAFDFDQPRRMWSNTLRNCVVFDTKNFDVEEAKHSEVFAEIMDLLNKIADIFDEFYPYDSYKLHKTLVKKFESDERVIKLGEIIQKNNICLYGARMHEWLHDYDNLIFVFIIAKFPNLDASGEQIFAYDVAIPNQIYRFLNGFKPVEVKPHLVPNHSSAPDE